MPQVTLYAYPSTHLQPQVIRNPKPEDLKAYAKTGVPFRLHYGAGAPVYASFTSR